MNEGHRFEDGEPVGRGKPPKSHRFDGSRPGPGRPLGSKNKPKRGVLSDADQMFLDEAARVLEPNLGLTVGRAVIRAQIKTAIQGGTNAQKIFTQRHADITEKESRLRQQRLESYETYALRCEEMLAQASSEQRQKLEEGFLPHPSDIEVDFDAGTVIVRGPSNRRERDSLKAILAGLQECATDVLALREELEVEPNNFSLQRHYVILITGYCNIIDALPARFRPTHLPAWDGGDKVLWWYNDAEYKQRSLEERRRLQRLHARRPTVQQKRINRVLKPLRPLWDKPRL